MTQAREKAQVVKIKQDVDQFKKAFEIYRLSHGHYPACNDVSNYNQDCYISISDGADLLGNVSTDLLFSTLKNDKVLSANFIRDNISYIKDASFSYRDSLLFYTAAPIIMHSDGPYDMYCGGKNINTFKEFFFTLDISDKNGSPIDLSGLMDKFTDADGNVFDFCTGN